MGCGSRDLTANVNFFSRVDVGNDGSRQFVPDHSQAGSVVELSRRDERARDPQHVSASARPRSGVRAQSGACDSACRARGRRRSMPANRVGIVRRRSPGAGLLFVDSTTNAGSRVPEAGQPCGGAASVFGSVWVPLCGDGTLLQLYPRLTTKTGFVVPEVRLRAAQSQPSTDSISFHPPTRKPQSCASTRRMKP